MAMLEIRDRGDVVVATIQPVKILDELTIRKVGEEFKKLSLEAAADRKLLVNFQRVTFMSSSMIGQIMLLSRQCRNDKIQLKLCNISASIMEIFTLMRLHKVLDIYKSEDEAIDAFGGVHGRLF
jgi:anti-anti-sigma factor